MKRSEMTDEEKAQQDLKREAEQMLRKARIVAADIGWGYSTDFHGAQIAQWTDSQGRDRTTMFKSEKVEMYGGEGWSVAITDWDPTFKSFSSGTAQSMESAKAAVEQWIASLY